MALVHNDYVTSTQEYGEPIKQQDIKRRRRYGRKRKSKSRQDQSNEALHITMILLPAIAGLRLIEGTSSNQRFAMSTFTNSTQNADLSCGDCPLEAGTHNTWSSRDVASFSRRRTSNIQPDRNAIYLEDGVFRSVNFISNRNEISSDAKLIDAVFNPFSANKLSESETHRTKPIHQMQQNRHLYNSQTTQYSPRPRLVIELDTSCSNSGMGNNRIDGMKGRIRSRIENREWKRMPNLQSTGFKGPTLSISLDPFAPSPSQYDNFHEQVRHDDGNAMHPAQSNIPHPGDGSTTPKHQHHHHRTNDSLLRSLLFPTAQAATTLLTQTTLLIPPLIISRRILNSTWNALVDYFRGRYFRTTFTRLERAYLRYYEFPALTRAVWRTVSQMGILMALSWVVRWWMIVALAGNGVGGPMMWIFWGGATDGGAAAAAGLDSSSIWKVGLPCQSQTTGVAMVCAIVWIGAVVGAGHACAMVLSVWGGPLRLQATAQPPEKARHILRRIIHHPVQWVRDLEEWKHFSSLGYSMRAAMGEHRKEKRRGRVFDPDPSLFPSTWMPLRWLQIFAISKAFATDPFHYRWCSPDSTEVVIPKLMRQYLVQLALGDEWHRVFLGEKRVGLGIVVIFCHFIALIWMVCTTFTIQAGAAILLIPSILAAMISAWMNLIVFWNRMGNKERRAAMNAMGWTDHDMNRGRR